MKQIPLTQGKFALVDDLDYDYLMQWSWSVKIKGRNKLYAVAFDRKNKKKISMHRLLLNLSDPSIHCDHKDGNGLNNQRSNLRPATCSQNNMNRGVSSRNKLEIKGVSFHRASNKYEARIGLNNKNLYLGIFPSASEAAAARKKAEVIYHKEFAYQE